MMQQQQAPPQWSPFRDLQELQQQTAQLMEGVLSAALDPSVWVPPVDIEETEDAWIIDAELPGADKADINVDVRGNELAITGEIKEKERAGILRRRTRRVGEFEFRVVLPEPVDSEHVDASFDGGILHVRVPRQDRARSRHVEIGSGTGEGQSMAAGQPAGQPAGAGTGASDGESQS
jgi:HSP20 family protein